MKTLTPHPLLFSGSTEKISMELLLKCPLLNDKTLGAEIKEAVAVASAEVAGEAAAVEARAAEEAEVRVGAVARSAAVAVAVHHLAIGLEIGDVLTRVVETRTFPGENPVIDVMRRNQKVRVVELEDHLQAETDVEAAEVRRVAEGAVAAVGAEAAGAVAAAVEIVAETEAATDAATVVAVAMTAVEAAP